MSSGRQKGRNKPCFFSGVDVGRALLQLLRILSGPPCGGRQQRAVQFPLDRLSQHLQTLPGAPAEPLVTAPIYPAAHLFHHEVVSVKQVFQFVLVSSGLSLVTPLLFPSALSNDGVQDTISPNLARWHFEFIQLKEFEEWQVLEGLSDLPLKQIIEPSCERYRLPTLRKGASLSPKRPRRIK